MSTQRRPYAARQEELVRTINQVIAKKSQSRLLLAKLRQRLIDEQKELSGPTLAFISGCQLINRLDLLQDDR
jgi:hypothetical protein